MTSQGGSKFWCVKFRDGSVVRLTADEAIIEDGAVLFRRTRDGAHESLFSVGPGHWQHFFAANKADGGPICVDHWDLPKRPATPPATKARTKKRR